MPCRRLRGPVLCAAALALALVLSACGGSPGTIGPSGVDQLTIPSLSPDPADFVDQVDNRWLPLPQGARWTYRVDNDPPESRDVAEVTAQVSNRRPRVAGVTTTEYVELSRAADGRLLSRARSWYAQDRAGNVWLLGQRSEFPDSGQDPRIWRAGDGDVGAGLAMPADPRLGDGFWYIRVPGSIEVRARVTSVTGTLETAQGPASEVVELEFQDDIGARFSYAPGIGLVQVDAGRIQMTLTTADLPVDR